MDEKNICTKFGNNIKKYRLKKGFSQEELAELSNLHRTYISAVERGKRSISLKNIEILAKTLSVSIQSLFMFEE